MKNLQQILNDFTLRVLKEQEFYSERARVISIDEETVTCKVETLDAASVINKVILSAYRGASFGLFLIPKIGSVVTVSYYSKDEAFISKTAELSAVRILFDETDGDPGSTIEVLPEQISINSGKILINSEETIFNDGELLGLVKIEEMTARLNELEALLQQLNTDFASWIPVPSDGGAALKTALTAGYLMKPVPDSKVADFENEKIKQ